MQNLKTHWKKNIDSAYISGEDMQAEIKGLRKEMVVQVASFNDGKTFDQKKNADQTITAINLWDCEDNKAVYKPIVLNKTNARFLEKEFNSSYVEDWIGKPFVLFAQPDRRHGHVVRCRKFVQQNIDLTPYLSQVEACGSNEELTKLWGELPQNIKNYKQVKDAFTAKKQ